MTNLTIENTSLIKHASISGRAENLKYAIRSGESTLRLIDVFAAEEAVRQLGASHEIMSALAFDITLALSYASSQGYVALTLSDFERYEECFYSFRQLALAGRAEPAAEGSWVANEEPNDTSSEARASLFKRAFEEYSALLIIELEALGLAAPITYERTHEQGRWSLRRFKHLQSAVDQFVSSRLALDKYTAMEDSTKRAMRDHVARLFDNNLKSADVSGVDADTDCENQIDHQALAAAQSLLSRLVFVSGGPGTGKTTTAARMLVLNLLQANLKAETDSSDEKRTNQDHEISALCLAPTGKAAQRLAASIRVQVFNILGVLSLETSLVKRLLSGLSSEGLTMHRYLIDQGAPMDELYAYDRRSDNQRVFGDGGPSVKHTPSIVIVDESSMIDLALMQRFISTVRESTTVVFLGDHFQLPPVEAGEVFAEWVRSYSRCSYSSEQLHALAEMLSMDEVQLSQLNARQAVTSVQGSDASRGAINAEVQFNPVVQLLKTYRFGGALGEFARLIRDADYQDICSFLAQLPGDEISVTWNEAAGREQVSAGAIADTGADTGATALYGDLVKAYRAYVDAVQEQSPLPELHACFEKFQVLCSTRKGPLGTEAINAHIEQAMMNHLSAYRDRDSIETNRYMAQSTAATRDKAYHGKPILIESNYPHLDVYNGDVGFVIDDAVSLSSGDDSSEKRSDTGRRYSIQFYRGDDQAPVSVPYHKISGYSLAYAMTVHKSQGSEYQNVSVVIAPYASEMLSRALLYTAVTRSKSQVHVYVSKGSLQQSLSAVQH